MNAKTVGFAMCGSFCTFERVLPQLQALKDLGANVIPILSEAAYNTDTRFGSAEHFRQNIESICAHKILHTLTDVEPFGPKKLLDLLIVAPCTGNTLGKLAGGITDSCVTLAVKAHLRNERPVLLAVSTNDALSASAPNIGKLLNTKHIFFVPMRQDNAEKKPTSVVADFDKIPEAAQAAVQEKQLQPILL